MSSTSSAAPTMRVFHHYRAQRVCVYRTEVGLPRPGWFWRSDLNSTWMPCTSPHPPGGAIEVPAERESEPARMVRAFHRAYDVRTRVRPVFDVPELQLRRDLLAEEHREYEDACEAGDLVELADALADMVYIVFGTALTHGIDLDAVLAEVHRSNMSKLGEDGRPVLRDDGKVLKGPRYRPPDVAAVLAGGVR